MFDSGGSSGVLRDELGVLPPGDILKCALALARNAREARRVLLARLPTLEHARLGGHTGGNLLLSMMQRYSGDFLDAIDGLRALLGCRGRVWPVSVEQASVCAEYGDGSLTRGEVEVDAGQSSGRFVQRIWLEPAVSIHPAVADGDRAVRRGDHRSRQLLHEPDADLPGPRRGRGAARDEGTGHPDRQPADRRARHGRLHRRRRRGAHRRRDSAAGRRRHHQRAVAERRRSSAATRSSTRNRSRRAICRRTANWSAAISGRATSRGTIACASPTRCGASSRGGCSSTPEASFSTTARSSRSSDVTKISWLSSLRSSCLRAFVTLFFVALLFDRAVEASLARPPSASPPSR